MCNCVRKLETKLKDELPQKNDSFKNMIINNVYCNSSAWIYGKNGMVHGISIPFTIEHLPIRRKKTTVIYVTAKYCPFCGDKLPI